MCINLKHLFATSCCSFAVNIGLDDQNITLHINPRFNAHGDENAVVCNSYQGGKWCEEVRGESFPFKQAEEFKVCVYCSPACVSAGRRSAPCLFLSVSDLCFVPLITIIIFRTNLWTHSEICVRHVAYYIELAKGVKFEISTLSKNGAVCNIFVYIFFLFLLHTSCHLDGHDIHLYRVPGDFIRRLCNQLPQPHRRGEVLRHGLRWGCSHHKRWNQVNVHPPRNCGIEIQFFFFQFRACGISGASHAVVTQWIMEEFSFLTRKQP